MCVLVIANIVSRELEYSDDQPTMSNDGTNSTADAVQRYLYFLPLASVTDAFSRGILVKLIAFSVSLAIVPLASYFASLKYVWNGESMFTYSLAHLNPSTF